MNGKGTSTTVPGSKVVIEIVFPFAKGGGKIPEPGRVEPGAFSQYHDAVPFLKEDGVPLMQVKGFPHFLGDRHLPFTSHGGNYWRHDPYLLTVRIT
jgi:hypothetical protein